jgi:hypothetical protein
MFLQLSLTYNSGSDMSCITYSYRDNLHLDLHRNNSAGLRDTCVILQVRINQEPFQFRLSSRNRVVSYD